MNICIDLNQCPSTVDKLIKPEVGSVDDKAPKEQGREGQLVTSDTSSRNGPRKIELLRPARKSRVMMK